MNAKKEAFFVKMTKKKCEEMAKDQAHISKILAKFVAKYGEPIKEVFEANEEGEKVGKMHRKFEFEDRLREELAKKKDELVEMARQDIESDISKRVKELADEKINGMERKEISKLFIDKSEKEGATAIVLSLNFKQNPSEGIVAACGTTSDTANLMHIAAGVHEHVEASVVLAAKKIVEEKIEPCTCGKCHR